MPAEGKTTTTCNLAITLAQAGRRVVLVEGDLRRPRLAEYLGIEGAVGLTSVLIGRIAAEDALQPWGDIPLEVLASGPLPPNPSELLQSRAMELLLGDLERRADVVLVDAPPLLPVTDASILARMADGTVLVVRHGQHHRRPGGHRGRQPRQGRRTPARHRAQHGAGQGAGRADVRLRIRLRPW